LLDSFFRLYTNKVDNTSIALFFFDIKPYNLITEDFYYPHYNFIVYERKAFLNWCVLLFTTLFNCNNKIVLYVMKEHKKNVLLSQVVR